MPKNAAAPTSTPPINHGAYSTIKCLTASSCSSSVKYSSAMASPLPAFKTQQDPQAFIDLDDGAFLLRHLLAQTFHRDHAPGHFVIPQNDRKLCAALIRALELRLEAPAAEIDLQCEVRPGVAQLLRQFETCDLRAFPRQHKLNLSRGAPEAQPLLSEELAVPLMPEGPADPRGAGAAQLGHQAVVASSGTHGTLRTERVRRPLENRSGVVVESADQVRLDIILDAGAAQVRAQGLEMSPRLCIQGIEQQRRPGDDALHVRILAVEYSQRIALQPPFAIFVERGLVPAEIAGELFAICRARSRRSQRIDQELRAGQSETPQQARGQENDFGVDIRSFESECLRIDLMELAVASRLRPFAPEHRTHAPDAQAPLAQHSVRNDGADDAGGRLGAQRDVILALVDEAEHLLLDDIGKVADRALEQLRLLDHGNAEFFVTVTREDLSRDALQVLPGRYLRGQHIVYAAQGLDNLGQEPSPISPTDARRASRRRASPRRALLHRASPRCGNRGARHRRRRPRSALHRRPRIAARSRPPGC